MAQILVTGSTDGLGRAAAMSLAAAGHRVVLHARNEERAAAVADIAANGASIVVGDLRSAVEVRSIAAQVNTIGRMDAVIHNAGIYLEKSRGATPEKHATTLAVNTLAPYMLTALIARPGRLIYLSSGLHRHGAGSLQDIDWIQRRWDGAQAYAETKLHVVALALALARRWPDVISHAVDPGWVRTRMGGSSATTDIDTGQRTQSWLAISEEPVATTSGGYWHRLRRETPAPEAMDTGFQDRLLAKLGEMTGVVLRDE